MPAAIVAQAARSRGTIAARSATISPARITTASSSDVDTQPVRPSAARGQQRVHRERDEARDGERGEHAEQAAGEGGKLLDDGHSSGTSA